MTIPGTRPIPHLPYVSVQVKFCRQFLADTWFGKWGRKTSWFVMNLMSWERYDNTLILETSRPIRHDDKSVPKPTYPINHSGDLPRTQHWRVATVSICTLPKTLRTTERTRVTIVWLSYEPHPEPPIADRSVCGEQRRNYMVLGEVSVKKRL